MAGLSLPDFPRVDDEILREISRRHDLDAEAASPLAEVGVFDRIYPLGRDLGLRVPRDHPAFVAVGGGYGTLSEVGLALKMGGLW